MWLNREIYDGRNFGKGATEGQSDMNAQDNRLGGGGQLKDFDLFPVNEGYLKMCM